MLRTVAVTLWLGFVTCASASIAVAQPETSESTAAEVLFQRARQLAAEGKYAEACPRFEESLRVDPAPGTKLNLADCWEHLGRTASAWSMFLEVAEAARAARLPDNEKIARDRAGALEPKLARLEIDVPGAEALAGLVVERDGQVVAADALGRAVPVDPGHHRVLARAEGKRAFLAEADVTAASTSTIHVELGDANAPAPVMPGPRPRDAAPAPQGLGPRRIAALGAGAIGVAGIAVGAVFGLDAKSKHDEAQASHCPQPTHCDTAGAELTHQAFRSATVSTVAFAVGGVALAGAALLWVTAPTPRARVTASARPGAASLGLEGAW